VTGLANFENDPHRAVVASRARDESEQSIVHQLASDRVHGGLAYLVAAGLSTDDIVGNVRLCMSGGINEPRDGIALVAWTLLTHRDELARCRADATKWRPACEELFRWISPVATATRQTTQDVTIGDVTIPAGAMVAAVISSANRDERRWSDPDRYRRVAVQRLFERLPNLALVDSDAVEIRGFEFRGPTALSVVF
jgi:cytochrome P450